jgi:hypothetical protein
MLVLFIQVKEDGIYKLLNFVFGLELIRRKSSQKRDYGRLFLYSTFDIDHQHAWSFHKQHLCRNNLEEYGWPMVQLPSTVMLRNIPWSGKEKWPGYTGLRSHHARRSIGGTYTCLKDHIML